MAEEKALEREQPQAEGEANTAEPKEQKTPKGALSSQIINPVTIALLLVAALACGYFEQTALALFCGFVFVFFLCSWLWGRFSVRRVEYTLSLPAGGLFPGQKFPVKRTLVNDKLLPLVWLELAEPCDPDGPALPDERFIAEKPGVLEEDTPRRERYVCLYSFMMLKWKQTLRFSDEWTAHHRGIHTIGEARIRSGDGFGLYVANHTFTFGPPKRLVVYPALVGVSEEKILQEMWDSRSATAGYLEDVTLLRSVRDYQRGAPARRINQRLLARGQGLSVNEYQVVTPDTVLFVFDAASFAGAPEAMEEALSVLASLLVGLRRRGIAVGLAAGKSAFFPQSCTLPTQDEQALLQMLELLAAAGQDDAPLKAPLPIPAPELMGRTYYITHSMGRAKGLSALAAFPPHKAQILVWQEDTGVQAGEVRIRPLRAFMKGGPS